MTSSSCSELVLRQGRQLLGRVELDLAGATVRVLVGTPVSPSKPIELVLRRPASAALRGEVRIGDDVELVVPPGRAEVSSSIAPLRDEFGEVVLSYRESDPEDIDAAVVLCEVCFEIDASKEVRALFEGLVEDLERVHLGLARDVLGRTRQRIGHRHRAPRLARPEEDCQLLEAALRGLDESFARIGRQPVHAIARSMVRDRWRPGDRLAADAMTTLLQDPDTVLDEGRPRRVGRVRIRRSHTTLDIPEHRMLRSELDDLARRAARISGHCAHCIEQLRTEQQRWGGARADDSSVFDTEHLPRIRRYEALAERAAGLAAAFTRLRRRSAFLDEAAPSRSGLRPTPLFLNGLGYRDAYGALRAARRSAAPLVSGDEFRIHFRSLARLYEYWCFVQVVERMRAWFGQPQPYAEYEVVDDTYRPDLRPGQWFRFSLANDAAAVVHYEPDVVPWTWTQAAPLRYRATLSSAPLRPDVLVELLRPGVPPVVLVLDAKSTTRFDRDALWKPTDYRSRIVDPESGTQPVRQAFFLHRDERSAELENVPGYLAGGRGDAGSWVIGAVPCLPWTRPWLTQVLRRFLRVHAGELDVVEEDVDRSEGVGGG